MSTSPSEPFTLPPPAATPQSSVPSPPRLFSSSAALFLSSLALRLAVTLHSLPTPACPRVPACLFFSSPSRSFVRPLASPFPLALSQARSSAASCQIAKPAAALNHSHSGKSHEAIKNF